MTTTTDIAISRLHASPANPRRNIGDVSELAASIRAIGLLEPLVVRPNDDGFEVVCGARRLAAAAKAGLTEVACTVKEMDDRAFLEAALAENLQRENLTVLEEAEAYAGLVKLGHSQRELAKQIGRSQAHISRRLSLLKLPAPALDALDTGRITIDEAITLARVPASKVAEVFKGKGSVSYEVGKVIREQEHAEKVAAARAELAKTGVTVIETIPTPAWKHRLDGPDGYGHLRLTPEEHAGEPCHVAVLHWEKVELYCTDPDRHGPAGDSDLKTPIAEESEDEDDEEPAETPEERAAQAIRRAERESQFAAQGERKARRSEAIEARRAFAATAIADVDAAGAVELTALLYAHCFYVEDPFDRQTADLLGLEKDTFNNTPAAEQVRAYAAKGSRNRTRAVAAAAACLFETMATPSQYSLVDEHVRLHEDDDEAGARAWFAWLVGRGYELSDHDRELLPEPEPPTEEQPEDAVAWYDDPEEGPRWVDASEAQAIEGVDAAHLHYLEGQPNAEDELDAKAFDAALDPSTCPGFQERPGGAVAGNGCALCGGLPSHHGPASVEVYKATKAAKKWTWLCTACRATGTKTTEAYAREMGDLHLSEAHAPAPAKVGAEVSA